MVLEETNVMFSSMQGVSNARPAFEKLESKLSTLRARKFFGYYNPETEEYRACVAIITGDPEPESLGLKKWTIPEGKYIYEKIMDWTGKISLIGPTMEKLIEQNNALIDWSRPILEFYKSQNELRLLIPVTG